MRNIYVVGIAPIVTNQEERFYLSAFLKQRWPEQEFRANVEAGNFDGLLVLSRGRVYTVNRGRMVLEGKPLQMQLEGVNA